MLLTTSTVLAETAVSHLESLVGLRELWTKTQGDPRICVAVLDGPVDLSHPSLAEANLTVLDSVGHSVSESSQAARHGTHITSLIFGQHGSGVTGIAPRCRGLVIPIFNDGADGTVEPCSQVALGRAIRLACEHGAHVVNVSAGQYSPNGMAHPVLADAIRECSSRGSIIVAAAGNQGCECLHVPGAIPSVLAVGAMDSNGDALPFSNWGGAYQTKGILAPGENVVGAVPGGGVEANRGTSFATPLVSGVSALLMSLQLQQQRKPNPGEILNVLIQTALGCEHKMVPDCRRLLAGRLNLQGALSKINQGDHIMSVSGTLPNTLTANRNDDELSNGNTVSEMETRDIQAAACGCQDKAPPAARSVSEADDEEERQSNGSDSAIQPVTMSSRPTSVRRHAAMSVSLSDCGCGGGGGELVYALGSLSHDLGTLARQDSLSTALPDHPDRRRNIHFPGDLLDLLEQEPSYATSVIWTLNHDAMPIFAIRPAGAFAPDVFKYIREFYAEQIEEKSEVIAVPGYITGSVTLYSGQTVPVINPEIRGFSNWTVEHLVRCVRDGLVKRGVELGEDNDQQELRNFLNRIYYEFRNMGMTPQERALNFAGTNAFGSAETFSRQATNGMQLDEIGVEPSPICRPDSECWDVKIVFFNPDDTDQARTVARFTVDVSDVVPVIVGEVREWKIR